jgi:hypothetical protein
MVSHRPITLIFEQLRDLRLVLAMWRRKDSLDEAGRMCFESLLERQDDLFEELENAMVAENLLAIRQARHRAKPKHARTA